MPRFFWTIPYPVLTPSSVQIVVVNDETSTGNVLPDAQTNSLIRETLNAIHNAVEMKVTDETLLEDIENNMNCATGKEPVVSDYIHFSSNASGLDTVAENRIDEFVCRVGGQATKWGVFGHASEPGSDDLNRELSWKRACEVKKQLCNVTDFKCEENYDPNKPDGGYAELKCEDKSVPLFGKGEAHFINGAANSRSVVIAACRAARGEDGTGNKPDTTAPACPAPD